MADTGDAANASSCSSASEDFKNPLEIAATAGATLSTPHKANLLPTKKVKNRPNPAGKNDIGGTVVQMCLLGRESRSSKTNGNVVTRFSKLNIIQS